MIQEKKCKGINKAQGFKGCGKLVPANTRRYGLCFKCWPAFLTETDAGKVIVAKSIFKVQKPRLMNEASLLSAQSETSLKKAKKQLKEYVHAFIRERDKGLSCISCNAQWNPEFQAGHFFKAETFETLKYSTENIHGQCVQCNIRKDGNFDNYALNLPNRIGTERYNALVELAQVDKHFSKVWDLDKIKAIREQVKELKKGLKTHSQI